MNDRRVIDLLRKAKTMSISVCDDQGPWGIKVYYAMHDGFIFLLENEGRTLKAVQKNPIVSFSIDLNKPDLFVQGEGKVEVLGDPTKLERERGVLLSKVPEDILFINMGNVVLVRLVPERIRVTDMSDEPKKYYADFNLEELNEKEPVKLLRALRPWSLQMSVSAMILGVLLARQIVVTFFLLAILGIIMVHGAFNALSDYFDYISKVDLPNGMGSAGSRVLIDGLVKPRFQLAYSLFLLTASLMIGVYLASARASIIPFIILGLVAGLMYGIPKVGLKWLALGDLGVMLAFGPGIVLGTEALMGAKISTASVLISVAIGMVIVAVLHANNWRDMEDDKRAGIKTVAILLGEKWSKAYYIALIWLSYALFALAVFLDRTYWPILGSFLTIPWAYRLTKIAMNPKSWKRKILDQQTGFFTALHMYFSIAFMLVALIVLYVV